MRLEARPRRHRALHEPRCGGGGAARVRAGAGPPHAEGERQGQGEQGAAGRHPRHGGRQRHGRPRVSPQPVLAAGEGMTRVVEGLLNSF